MREIECFISIMHCSRQAESLISQLIALSMQAGETAFQFHQTAKKNRTWRNKNTHRRPIHRLTGRRGKVISFTVCVFLYFLSIRTHDEISDVLIETEVCGSQTQVLHAFTVLTTCSGELKRLSPSGLHSAICQPHYPACRQTHLPLPDKNELFWFSVHFDIQIINRLPCLITITRRFQNFTGFW